MSISSRFLLLVLLSPLLMAQQRMMPHQQDPHAQRLSGVTERGGERPGMPPLLIRPGRPAEEPECTPEHWWMRSQQFDGGKLALAKETHTADTFYLPDTVIAYGTDTTRHTYTYDASGNRLTWLWEEWEGSQWVSSSRSTNSYDASGNMLTHLWEEWDGSQWVSSSRSTNSYDASGNKLTELLESGSGTQWVNSSRATYTYDASGNMLTEVREEWNGTQWVSSSLSTYFYDASGNKLERFGLSWNGSQWANSFRNSFTYDASGNVLTEWKYTWDGVWVNYLRTAYSYDASGNLSRFNAEGLSSTWAWEPRDCLLSFSIGKNYYWSVGYQITLGYTEITTSVAAQQEGLTTSYELAQNYPNPFNPSTTIEYILPHTGHVTLRVYNVLGEQVATLVERDHAAGTFKTTWDASGLPSGVYFYRLSTGEYVQTRKMVLMR